MDDPTIFMDPNTFSEDGTTSFGVTRFSDDGVFFAYGLSSKGSDWQTIRVKTVDEDHPLSSKLDEVLEWIKFSSIAWTKDHKGFFYARYPKPKLGDKVSAGTETEKVQFHQLYYHRLGTPQSEDILVIKSDENPEWMFSPTVTHDGHYLVVTISKDCDPVNLVYYADITKLNENKEFSFEFVRLIDTFIGEFIYVNNEGQRFLFKTNHKAPLNKLIEIDLTQSDIESWKDILPESTERRVLTDIKVVNHKFLAIVYNIHASEEIFLYGLDGSLIQAIELPTFGTIMSISGNKEESEFFFSFGSYLLPETIYRYDFNDIEKCLKLFRRPEIKNYDADALVSERMFYKSKDGTQVPIYISYKKGLEKNGNNPVLLYGYGGFNISITPTFNPLRAVWMQNMNGVYAVANIRGGSEYGDEWHKMGTKENKQNVFDDFQCAAEFLIKEKFTAPKKIAILGGSNGGLLVGACVNQRPDLFGVGVAAVGVMDMLNFHRYTIGHAWTSDYGCADNAEDFEYLYKYSPIHNVKENVPYPSVLLTTADHDDRVVPLHSYKLIAELQSKVGSKPYQKKPLLIRIEKSAGHGAGKSTNAYIKEMLDIYSFIAIHLDIEWTE